MAKNNLIETTVSTEMAGQRLDKTLAMTPEVGSRSRAAQLIDQSLVKVNSELKRSSYLVKLNDHISIEIPAPKDTELLPYAFPLDVYFEDKDLAVINKPPGLVVHPAAGHDADTLVNALINRFDDLHMKFGDQRPGIVHRLDKDTSGLLVIAKNDWTQGELQKQFKLRTVERCYFAVVEGLFRHQSLQIQSYLSRHPKDRKRFASLRDRDKKIIGEKQELFERGKWAVTHAEFLAKHPSKLSYLKLKLETGRTHQIRVHLSELGLPILGDSLYGSLNRQKIPRLALHAATLGFVHPRTNESLSFTAPWPNDLSGYLKTWGFL